MSDAIILVYSQMIKKAAMYYRKYAVGPITEDDLLTAGMVGVWMADKEFDPDKGLSFTMYVFDRIRYAIRGRISEEDRDVRRDWNGGHDTPDNMAMKIAHYNERVEETPCDSIDLDKRNKLIHKMINALPPKRRGIVKAYYFEDRTFREIGDSIELSHQRVNQLLVQARSNLRRSFRELTKSEKEVLYTEEIT